MRKYSDNYEDDFFVDDSHIDYDEDLEKYWEELEKETARSDRKKTKAEKVYGDYDENNDDDY